MRGLVFEILTVYNKVNIVNTSFHKFNYKGKERRSQIGLVFI